MLGDQTDSPKSPFLGSQGERSQVHARRDVGGAGIAKDVVERTVISVAVDLSGETTRGAVIDEEREARSERGGEVADEAEALDRDGGLLVLPQAGD